MIPTGAIPRHSSLPGGSWKLKIDHMEIGPSVEGAAVLGVKAVKVTFSAVAPMPGMQHFEQFVIGTQGDPSALDKSTWVTSLDANRMMQMLDAAKVPGIGDQIEDDELCKISVGYLFDAVVSQAPDKKGVMRSRITAFLPAGSLDTGTQPGPELAPAPKPRGRPKAAAPIRPLAPPVATEPEPDPAPEIVSADEPEYVDEEGNPCDSEGNPLPQGPVAEVLRPVATRPVPRRTVS